MLDEANADAESSLSGLLSFLSISPEPAYIVSTKVEWRNQSAGSKSPPHAIIRTCQGYLSQTGSAHQLSEGWHLTIIERGKGVLVRKPYDQPDVRAIYETLLHSDVPGIDAAEQASFLELFFGFDWSITELGAMTEWSLELWQLVNTLLLSPDPVMLIYGVFSGRCLYNAAYTKVAGKRHPNILGQKYHEAWSEVWPQVEQIWSPVWNGKGMQGRELQILLARHGRLEETYFDFAMIPIFSDGRVIGAWHPLTESTSNFISRRRLKLLNDLNSHTADAARYPAYWAAVAECLGSTDIAPDLPLYAIYAAPSKIDLARQANSVDYWDDDVSPDRQSWRKVDEPLFAEMRRRGSEYYDDLGDVMNLVSGEIAGACLPDTIHLLRPKDLSTSTAAERLLRQLVQRLQRGEMLIGLDAEETRTLFGQAKQQKWPEDEIHRAVICGFDGMQGARHPVKAEQPLSAVAVFALNTRRPFNAEYEGFIRVLSAQISSGLSAIRSTSERVLHAHYLAFTKHMQHQDVALELERRTRDLTLQELHFSRLIDLLPVGIWQASGPEASIKFVNEAWWQVSGHPRNMAPDRFWESVHPDDVEQAKAVWLRSFAASRSTEDNAYPTENIIFRWRGRTPEGLERWCSSIALIEKGQDGFPEVTGVLSDLSHTKYAESVQKARADDAEQQKVRLNSFVDHLSHELRNPLGAISSGIDLVESRLMELEIPREPKEACEEELSSISYCLRHIQRLVDETLLMSKAEHELTTMHIEEFSPVSLARQTLRMFASDLRNKSITSSLIVSPTLELSSITVASDAVRIRQVLINLITNAIKFVAACARREICVTIDLLQDRPQLRGAISAGSQADHETPMSAKGAPSSPRFSPQETAYLRFDVQDTGVGLDETQQASLFRKWEQAFAPRTERNYGGSGLGLFFCRKITASLGGQCGLVSSAGAGSTFSFFVTCKPVSSVPRDSPPLLTQMSSILPLSSRRYKVLLVEDNLVNQRLLVKQLVRAGCNVTACDDGQHCLETVLEMATQQSSALPWDVCAMDCEMPRLNGLEATRRIRELEADGKLSSRPLPIVGISANARSEQRQMMLHAGMNATLPKPFRLAELMQAFEEAIGT